MNKEMKQLIKDYQAGANTDVIEEILEYVDEDLLQYKYGEGDTTTDVDGIVFIAYRIRAILMQHCFKDRNQKHIYEASEQDKEDYDALFGEGGWISDLSEKPWIDVNVDEMREFNFKSVYENRKSIEKYYGNTSYDLFYLCEKFKGRSQDSDEFRDDFERAKDKLLPLLLKALSHALFNVDAEKPDKQIVKYINIAMQTKFIELQMEQAGTKRIVKGGSSLYINPKFDEDAKSQAWMLMVGKSLKHIKDEWFEDRLTKNQRVFLMKLFEIVKAEIENENVDAFWWNQDSKPRLNNKYMADRMGMKEDNLRKTLKRISDKINVNWREIWSIYKNIG